MVNINIFSTYDSVTFEFYSMRVIIVLEHSYFKIFIKQSNLLDYLPPNRNTKQGKHSNIKESTFMVKCVRVCKLIHLVEIPISRFNPCFVATEVSHWPN